MNGILNILKAPGMTSHDVVSYIRKVTGIKKVGHTGTLDPGAAGVLPICIGKATKIVDYIMNDKKTYICELTLGKYTDTYDKYGTVTALGNSDYKDVSFETFTKVLNNFKGDILQKPPSYSALKVNGKRAYELARAGVEVDLSPRKVTIYEIEILKFQPPVVMLKIMCSKGTYIRSICNDIGHQLGCGGYMSFLLRTSTGKFTLENSHIIEEVNKENFKGLLVNADYAIEMRSIFVDEKLSQKILNGNSIKFEEINKYEDDENVKIYIKPDNFVAIGKIKGDTLKVDKLMI